MMDGYYGYGAIWMLLAALPWIALLGLAIWAAVRFANKPTGPSGIEDAGHRETPLEILDRRFASGEIDAATYDEARARLVGHDPRRG